MLFRRIRTLPPVPELPEFDREAVVEGLRALAADIEAGDPCGLVMMEDGIFGPDPLSAYPSDPYRQVNRKSA